nr:glycosyltransferase [uncultured Psychroserpens sp.]
MISVLIPVYNYDVIELVKTVHKQLELCGVTFEIKCLDDASGVEFQKQKHDIELLSYTSYDISKTNKGRIATRQQLAEVAAYEYLLFLDADVIPKKPTFIANYLNHINANYDVIYGGFAYKKEQPEEALRLRWTYGKNNEEMPASKRNEFPYKIVISGNFLIKKSVFIDTNSKINYEGYGFDNYFGALLKINTINVFHIDNEVYHLGIESSDTYLKKKEKAALTLIQLHNNDDIAKHDNHLLKLFITLKRYKLNYLASLFYKLWHSYMKKNLLGSNPSVKVLQAYRISFMCYKDLNS